MKKPTDSELLDALEAYIRAEHGLIIHDSTLPFPPGPYAGLGLIAGRTLRDAIRHATIPSNRRHGRKPKTSLVS